MKTIKYLIKIFTMCSYQHRWRHKLVVFSGLAKSLSCALSRSWSEESGVRGTLCGCLASIYIHILYMNFGAWAWFMFETWYHVRSSGFFLLIYISIHPHILFRSSISFSDSMCGLFLCKAHKEKFLESAHKLIFIYGIRNGHGTGVGLGMRMRSRTGKSRRRDMMKWEHPLAH